MILFLPRVEFSQHGNGAKRSFCHTNRKPRGREGSSSERTSQWERKGTERKNEGAAGPNRPNQYSTLNSGYAKFKSPRPAKHVQLGHGCLANAYLLAIAFLATSESRVPPPVERKWSVFLSVLWIASTNRTVLLRTRISTECVVKNFPWVSIPRKRGDSLIPVAQKIILFPLARSFER